MTPLQHFLEYAQDFEKTYEDDDWSRLERYFAPDAVYEVRNTAFACRLQGPAAILRGMKKSIDGFDRRLPKRALAVTSPPLEKDDSVSFSWTATYSPPGAPPLVLRGRSTARYRGESIVSLCDDYPDGVDAEVQAWARQHAAGLDVSYV